MTIKNDYNYDKLDQLENNLKYLKLYYNVETGNINTLTAILFNDYYKKSLLPTLEIIDNLIKKKKIIEISNFNKKYTSKFYKEKIILMEPDHVLYPVEEHNFKTKKDDSDIFESLLKRISYGHFLLDSNDCNFDDDDGSDIFYETYKHDKRINLFIYRKKISDYGSDEEEDYYSKWNFLTKEKFHILLKKLNISFVE